MSDTAIERRDTALDKIVGTGSTRQMLAELEQNVRDIIDVARDRGFVTRFNNRDFFGFPAWSLLALTYGLTPVVEWTRQIDGGWEARSVVRTREGELVAAAEAMCTRQERQHQNKADHDLRAMAQTRAMRNSLRSCLGAALVMAGFDFADPEGPVTKEQLAALHILEREIGFTHDEGHAEAGVESFTQLNREEAAAVLDRWTAIRNELVRDGGLSTAPEQSDEGLSRPDRPDSDSGVTGAPEVGDPPGEESAVSGLGKAGAVTRTPSGDLPANPTAWERATKAGLTSRKAMAIARGLGFEAKTSAELTGDQLTACLSQYLDKGKK